jgi:hypothetical protein
VIVRRFFHDHEAMIAALSLARPAAFHFARLDLGHLSAMV